MELLFFSLTAKQYLNQLWQQQQKTVISLYSIVVTVYFEGSRPEWCISSMIYSGDTPFWLETLDLLNSTAVIVNILLNYAEI